MVDSVKSNRISRVGTVWNGAGVARHRYKSLVKDSSEIGLLK